MNRTEKKELVTTLHENLNKSVLVVVAHYKGLTVADMTDLRIKIRGAGAGLKVAKNRLAKIAIKETAYEPLGDLLTGPTVVAYASEPVAAAKVLSEFAKQNDKLIILGGAFGDRRMDVKGIEALAKMPSLDELRAKIIAILQTPATRIAGVLQAPAGQLARVTGAYAKKA